MSRGRGAEERPAAWLGRPGRERARAALAVATNAVAAALSVVGGAVAVHSALYYRVDLERLVALAALFGPQTLLVAALHGRRCLGRPRSPLGTLRASLVLGLAGGPLVIALAMATRLVLEEVQNPGHLDLAEPVNLYRVLLYWLRAALLVGCPVGLILGGALTVTLRPCCARPDALDADRRLVAAGGRLLSRVGLVVGIGLGLTQLAGRSGQGQASLALLLLCAVVGAAGAGSRWLALRRAASLSGWLEVVRSGRSARWSVRPLAELDDGGLEELRPLTCLDELPCEPGVLCEGALPRALVELRPPERSP